MSVHITRSDKHDAICGFDGPSRTMCGNTWASVDLMADCEDCISEYLRDKCSICNGTGEVPGGCDCCGWYSCQHCKAENFLEDRKREPGVEAKPAPPAPRGEK